MNYKNNILGRYLNGFSQLCHWFIGLSNTDISMSAKIGYKAKNGSKWFKFVEKIVDGTFELVGDNGHCITAYNSDKDEDYTIANYIWTDIVISILSILGCLLLYPLFWLVKTIKEF